MHRLRVPAGRESPAELGRPTPRMFGRAGCYSSPYGKVFVRKGRLSTPRELPSLNCPTWLLRGAKRIGAYSLKMDQHVAGGHQHRRGDAPGAEPLAHEQA